MFFKIIHGPSPGLVGTFIAVPPLMKNYPIWLLFKALVIASG